jgi:toxin YoeB
MNLVWTPQAWDDYLYWQKTDKAKVKRINGLIRDCIRSPFDGIGKPEPLRWHGDGAWSRRIDREHRLIYQVDDESLVIVQARFHYEQ